MSKARWAEFVNEYGNLDEVKNVFVLEQQAIENYEIKINKKFTLKSLLRNTSYAVEVDGVKTYYPVKTGSHIEIPSKEVKETLERTIKYEENIDDLTDESKVKLYEVDLELLPSIAKVKRKYVINIVSGNLYSIDQVHYEGLIYHTPRYGVKAEEDTLTIHYLPGKVEIGDEYTQNVKVSQSSSVKLDDVKFTGTGFIHWKDVTSRENPNAGDEEGNDGAQNPGEGFELKTEGYYGVVNGLSEILGDENWEENIYNIINTYSEEQDRIREIVEYLEQGDENKARINQEITNLNVPNGSISELAIWILGETDGVQNIEYIGGLKTYKEKNEEEGDTEATTGENEEYTTYNDGETINMLGEDIWLEAEWGESVTLVANGNGATVNGKSQNVIGVKTGEEYGGDLVDAIRAGYVFVGWWKDATDESNAQDRIYAYDTYDGSTKTLYAHWVPDGSPDIVTVTYNAGAGGIIKGTNSQTQTVKKVKNDTLGTIPIAIAGGVEFKSSWYDAVTGGNKVDGRTQITGNMTVYCQWSQVDLELNGGELATTYRIGNANYTNKFLEWNPVKYGTGTLVDKAIDCGTIRYTRKEGQTRGAIFVADGEKIGNQAGWRQLPVAYDTNSSSYNKTLNKWVSNPRWIRWIQKQRKITTKDGLISKLVTSKFIEWNTKEDRTGTKVVYNSNWSNINGNKLYAIWKERYGIIYDANGGYWKKNISGEEKQIEQQVNVQWENQKYPVISRPVRDDEYVAENVWYDAPIGGNPVYLGNATRNQVTKDITLYAHWQKVVFDVCNVSRYGFDIYVYDENNIYGKVVCNITKPDGTQDTITMDSSDTVTMNGKNAFYKRINISEYSNLTGMYRINAKIYDTLNNVISEQEKIAVVPVVNKKAKSITAESLIVGIRDNNIPDGYCDMTVNGKTYYLDVLNVSDSKIYDSSTGVNAYVLRKDYDLGTYDVSRTAVLKCDGSLTIEGKVTTVTGEFDIDDDGDGIAENRCGGLTKVKGLVICCGGKLTNNGEITMTARGTYDTPGENIYLWKNKSGTYEYVPAQGADGGAAISYSWTSKESTSFSSLGDNGKSPINNRGTRRGRFGS